MKKYFVLGLGILMLSNVVLAQTEVVDKKTNQVRDALQGTQFDIADAMRYTRDYFKSERLGRSNREAEKESEMGEVMGLQPFQVGIADSDKFHIDEKYIDNAKSKNVVQFISEDSLKHILAQLKEREQVAEAKIPWLLDPNGSAKIDIDPDTLLGKMQIKESEIFLSVPGEDDFEERKGRGVILNPQTFDPMWVEKYKAAVSPIQQEYARKEQAFYKQQELIEDLALILLAKEVLPCQSDGNCANELDTFEGMVQHALNGSAFDYKDETITIKDALAKNYFIRAEWLKLLAVKRQIKLLAQKVASYQGIQQANPVRSLMLSAKPGEEKNIDFQILKNEDIKNIGVEVRGNAWTI